MSFDRSITGFAAEQPAASAETSSPQGVQLPAALRLQILATEHWSLLATRSMTWNESFSRAGMFLATLSGSIVALALVAQATAFGPEFLVAALIILPVVLFIGLATFVRLVAANGEDVLWVQGMNRLRHAYLEMAPDLEPYLVTGWHDDEAGVLRTFGAAPSGHPFHHHVFVTTPAVVGTVDAVLGASVAGIVGHHLGLSPTLSFGLAAVAFVATAAALAVYQLRSFAARGRVGTVRFPTPPSGGSIDAAAGHSHDRGAPGRGVDGGSVRPSSR